MKFMEESRTFQEIVYLLDSRGVVYRVMKHEAVKTSEEAARVRGTPLKQGAKAMLFKADGRLVMLVLTADRRIDRRAFKKSYGVKDLRLLEPEELKELAGLEVGSVSPFGSLLGAMTYVDDSLLENGQIAFNAGSTTTSVIMSLSDYLSVERPQTGKFSTD